LVKQELSKRYYNHYLNIINTPSPSPKVQPFLPRKTPPPVDTADSGKDEPATDQLIGLEKKMAKRRHLLGWLTISPVLRK
jgi:hypothetical protein